MYIILFVTLLLLILIITIYLIYYKKELFHNNINIIDIMDNDTFENDTFENDTFENILIEGLNNGNLDEVNKLNLRKYSRNKKSDNIDSSIVVEYLNKLLDDNVDMDALIEYKKESYDTWKYNTDDIYELLSDHYKEKVYYNEYDIVTIYNYFIGSNIKRKEIIQSIDNNVFLIRYKKSDYHNPDNYRYYTSSNKNIKAIDYIWYTSMIKMYNIKMPNTDIFAYCFKKCDKSFHVTADENTKDINNVVLIDIKKAFDSVKWNVLKDLLYSHMKRSLKIDEMMIQDIINQYIVYWTEVIVKYDGNIISRKKGLPIGLVSGSLIFTFIIDEILHRWLDQNMNIIINVDFKINVYIDDIYIKILNTQKSNEIVNSLIAILGKYELKINNEKFKADPSLNLDSHLNELKETDLYLGIPFTRDITKYGDVILKELNKKYDTQFTWNQIYDILNQANDVDYKHVLGYISYKLRPFFNSSDLDDNNKLPSQKILQFIYDNYYN